MECMHATFNGFEIICFLSGDLCEHEEDSCKSCEDFKSNDLMEED